MSDVEGVRWGGEVGLLGAGNACFNLCAICAFIFLLLVKLDIYICVLFTLCFIFQHLKVKNK